MSGFDRKRRTPGELKFEITTILVNHMDFKLAHDLAYKIYADVLAPAIDDERKMWEELDRAKESGSLS
jgi:hypothetical protein